MKNIASGVFLAAASFFFFLTMLLPVIYWGVTLTLCIICAVFSYNLHIPDLTHTINSEDQQEIEQLKEMSQQSKKSQRTA